MTSFPETRQSPIVQVKDPSNRLAWEKFVDIYRPVIYRIAVAHRMQDADAQDLSQQVLLSVASAVQRWEKANEATRFRHWLRRIARNAVTRRPLDQPVGSPSGDDWLAECPVRGDTTDSMIDLEYRRELYLRAAEVVRADVRPDTWKSFELTVIDGMSNAQAAHELGKTLGTIYTARCRILQRLRAVVAELEESQS
ncbi:sigma-70 family RNA polymerase sigma factor [Novipirellula sp. SH528]|uniref:sigma-70 family RNA polymerase sigma factor n=1 Tax=Novipirellula sp. SH528 TaxID=3454466 RepID=UPI003FA103CB